MKKLIYLLLIFLSIVSYAQRDTTIVRSDDIFSNVWNLISIQTKGDTLFVYYNNDSRITTLLGSGEIDSRRDVFIIKDGKPIFLKSEQETITKIRNWSPLLPSPFRKKRKIPDDALSNFN